MAENFGANFRIDISDLKAGLKTANRMIRESESEFRAAAAGMDDWTHSQEGLEKRIKMLNDKAGIQREKVEALKKEYQRLIDKGLDPTSREASDLRIKINNETAALNKSEAEIKEQTEALENLGKEEREVGEEAEKATSGGLTSFGVALGNLAANIISDCINKLKELAAATVEAGMTFESSMSKVEAVSGATADEMEKLRDKAREMGETTQFTAGEAGDALNYMAMAGWKTEDMLNGIDGVMNLAAASGADLATTSDIVTDALTAFGEGAGEAGRLADIMAAASSNANTNVEMMGESFKYAAPVAGALGASMEDTATAIGLMANAGIKASNAGTALRTGFSNLVKPSKQAATYMERYNIEIKKNADGSVDLGATMEDLRAKMDGISETEQAAAASAIFGKNAMSGWLAIINASDADFNKLTDAINNSEGAAAQMSATMLDNLSGDITLMKSAFEGFELTLYDSFQAPLREGVQTITKELLPAAADLAKGVSGAGEKFGKTLAKIISKLGKKISEAIKKGLPKLIKIITEIAPDLIKAVSGIAVELVKALIASVPDLVTAILLIANDLIKAITEELPNLVNAIVEVVPDLVQALTDPEMFNQLMEGSIALMMAIVDAIPVIIQALVPQIPTIVENITQILVENAPLMLEASVQLFMGMVDAIPVFIEELIPALGQIWDSIHDNLVVPASEKLAEMWDGVKKGASNAWKGMKNVFKNAGDWYGTNVGKPIKEKFSGVWKKLKTGAADAWEGIKEAFGSVSDWFKDTFSEAWQKVKDVFSTGGEVFTGIVDGISDAFKTVVNALIRGINAVVATPFNTINDMLQVLRDFSFAGKHPFEDLPWLDTPQIPELARGGIVDGRSFIAGEDGTEAIIPLERNTAGLKKIAQLLAAEMSNGKTSAGASYVFNQTNNSPKALSRYEIYRQTRNLVAMAKGV